jgi:hypothetical protein
MHIPSLIGISKIYKLKGNTEKELKYKELAEEVRAFISNRKIEAEIRKYLK